MLICPDCKVEYDEGKKFCKNCGALLVNKEEGMTSSPEIQIKTTTDLTSPKIKEKEILPEGKAELKVSRENVLKYYREKREINLLIKEMGKLLNEKEEFEGLLQNLERQKGLVSEDIFSSAMNRYSQQFENLENRLQKIKATLNESSKKIEKETEALISELKPFQKKLGDVTLLYNSGALSKKDFKSQRKLLRKEIIWGGKALKTREKLLKFLNFKLELPSLPLIKRIWKPAFITLIALLVIGGGLWSFLHFKGEKEVVDIQKSDEMESKVVQPVTPPSFKETLKPLSEFEQIEKIIENIRQANLNENIELFMSCYSPAFHECEKKRDNTLNMWSNYDFLELDYRIEEKEIGDDQAAIILVWEVKCRSQKTNNVQELFDRQRVSFIKEDGNWRIVGTEGLIGN